MNPPSVEPQIVAWLEFLFIWTFLSFGLVTDKRYDDQGSDDAIAWQCGLACRAIIIAGLAVWFCGSWILGATAGAALFAQAGVRYRVPRFAIANECVPTLAIFLLSLAYIERFSIVPQHQIELDIDRNHLASLLIAGTAFSLALRWGAYLVKSVLRLALPSDAISDPKEIRRGFIIGILERMLLTVVVVLGSFSALGFLVAAKGLVRSHQFEGEKGRDFTEYFLIGTLTSVLIAVCAGLTLRWALHLLWPQLLLLDMKAD